MGSGEAPGVPGGCLMPGVGPTRVVALYSAAFGGIAGPESILVTLPPLSSDIDAEYVELHADLIVSPVADIGTVTFRWRANDVNGDQFGADFTLSQADMAAGGELSVSVSAVAVGANF